VLKSFSITESPISIGGGVDTSSDGSSASLDLLAQGTKTWLR
jgi:hypothetical protein